jgi:hypothetical protein
MCLDDHHSARETDQARTRPDSPATKAGNFLSSSLQKVMEA